ncbi:hypothetical protein [Fictibacillus phosphorivorans]|nr:hypothetical protein [Fictibacillus phosphorivorans]
MKRLNVAHRLPRGKRAPGTEINHLQSNNEYENSIRNKGGE